MSLSALVGHTRESFLYSNIPTYVQGSIVNIAFYTSVSKDLRVGKLIRILEDALFNV